VPWRAVVDLLPQLVAVVDDDGRVVDANVALAAAAGRRRELIVVGRDVTPPSP
jgi:PAS domain-containing protein